MPRETSHNLCNMVGAPVGTTRKRKRLEERGPGVIDTEIWLQEAPRQRHGRSIMFYTCHPPTNVPHGALAEKTQNAERSPHTRWTAFLSHMEDLTRRHLRTATQAYQSTRLGARTMKHFRDLRAHYNKALGAKRDYFKLLSTHLQGGIHITHHTTTKPTTPSRFGIS